MILVITKRIQNTLLNLTVFKLLDYKDQIAFFYVFTSKNLCS